MRIVRYSYPNYRTPVLATRGFDRSPWTGLESEIDRLFDTALTGFTGSSASVTKFPVDLHEDKDHTYVRAELPGVDRAEINVEVVDGYLTIAAARKTPGTDGKADETFSFSRSISVPEEVQTDQVTAAYENGILTVTLPKREAAEPKRIIVPVK